MPGLLHHPFLHGPSRAIRNICIASSACRRWRLVGQTDLPNGDPSFLVSARQYPLAVIGGRLDVPFLLDFVIYLPDARWQGVKVRLTCCRTVQCLTQRSSDASQGSVFSA